jgi:hypothetical protein
MVEPLSAHIMRLIPQAMHMYYRLVLVMAPLGAGKTSGSATEVMLLPSPG